MATKYGLPESFTSYHDTMRVELGKVIDSGHSALCNMLRYHMGWQSGIDCHLDFFGSILGQLYSQESIEGEDITKVTKILDQPGARDYTENLAEQYYCQASARLEATRLDTSTQGALKETACFLLKRDFQEGKCRKKLLKR